MSIVALGVFLLSAMLPVAVTPATSPTHSAIAPQFPTTSALSAASIACTHRVVYGDTLSHLAPSNWPAVAIQNGIADPNLIFIDQTIDLCVTDTTPSTTAPVGKSNGTFIPAVAKGPNTYPFGWCTYGAEQLAHDNLNGLGDASQWFSAAQRHGIPTGYAARPDSTAVFAPGYHVSNFGTSEGHVAHVDAVSGNMIEITEMNDTYWGAFGRYDTIWVQIVPGVSFIY